MSRRLLLAVLVCCCVVGVVFPAGATSHSAFQQEDIDPDDILLSVSIEENADAVWAVENRLRLDSAEDRQAFEDIRADIEANPDVYTDQFRERMNRTAATAESATNRSMSITEMTVSAQNETLPQEYGVVTYTFRWTNFAATDGERLVVGDAIQGMFLDEETRLLISWTDAYERLDASPDPTETRERAVVYAGELTFGSEQPRVELGPPGASTSDGSGGLSLSPLVLVAVLIVVLAAVVGVVTYRRRESGSTGGVSTTAQSSDSGDEPPDSETRSADAEAQSESATAEHDIDQDLLSNEEQVLQLIEQAGGRMKQKEVADRLDWTDAKTSQVTKKLREDGTLEGFRLGRENVLALPDETDEE